MTSTKVLKCIKTNVAQIECNGPYDTLGVTVAKFYQNQLKLPQTIEKYQISTTCLYIIHFSHYQMANIDHYWLLCHAFQPSLAITGMVLILQIHIGLSVI